MSKPTIKTAAGTNFHGSGQAGKQRLFTVTPGIGLADALGSASCLLSTLHDPIYAAATGEQTLEDNPAWLVLHTLESAKAVIDSLWKAAEEAEAAASAEQPAKE